MTRKRRRMYVMLACAIGLGSATALTLAAFGDNLVFFVSPSDVASKGAGGRAVRLGGLVQQGSVQRGSAGATFKVTDGNASITVHYAGILPDLFREGQGVVTLGALQPDGSFRASEVLAKHDETYMPKEVAEALKKAGQWKPETGAPPPSPTLTIPAPKGGG